jgi:hypothetical protein
MNADPMRRLIERLTSEKRRLLLKHGRDTEIRIEPEEKRRCTVNLANKLIG